MSNQRRPLAVEENGQGAFHGEQNEVQVGLRRDSSSRHGHPCHRIRKRYALPCWSTNRRMPMPHGPFSISCCPIRFNRIEVGHVWHLPLRASCERRDAATRLLGASPSPVHRSLLFFHRCAFAAAPASAPKAATKPAAPATATSQPAKKAETKAAPAPTKRAVATKPAAPAAATKTAVATADQAQIQQASMYLL